MALYATESVVEKRTKTKKALFVGKCRRNNQAGVRISLLHPIKCERTQNDKNKYEISSLLTQIEVFQLIYDSISLKNKLLLGKTSVHTY